MRICSYIINVPGFHLNPQAGEIREHLSGIHMERGGLKICVDLSVNAETVLVDSYEENNSNKILCFHSAINFRMYLDILSLI